ncbi:MAG: hypothetical protein WCK15_04580 [Pirellula sp.]
MAIVITQFNVAFSLKLDEYVCKLAWDAQNSLWAMTGKQQLYKLDAARNRHVIDEDTCKWFSLDGGLVDYVTDSDKIVVRSISDLGKVAEIQCDARVHRICLKDASIVIASNGGLSSWNFKLSRHEIINPRSIVAMDMCFFGDLGQVVIAEWNLLVMNTVSGDLRVLQSREYDVEYPFYSVTAFNDERLCVSSSCLEIFDKQFNCIASSSSIRAVDAVFLDDFTMVVREGGCQNHSARRREVFVEPSMPEGKAYRVIIAANSDAFAFDSKTNYLAVAGEGQLSVMYT